jgi:hypothetical protein
MTMLQTAVRRPALGFLLAAAVVALLLVDALLGTNAGGALYTIVPDPAGALPF